MKQEKQKSGAALVFWWVGWILLTILSFFVSCFFWTPVIGQKFGPVSQANVSLIWVAAVFGTWMVFLVPLIIVMYNKVDRAYEDARIRRETAAFKRQQSEAKVRSHFIPEEDRCLSKELRDKIKKIPNTIKQGHLLNATLRDGRKVENVFVGYKREVLGVYGLKELTFRIRDIVDLEPADPARIADCLPEHWLRLDFKETI